MFLATVLLAFLETVHNKSQSPWSSHRLYPAKTKTKLIKPGLSSLFHKGERGLDIACRDFFGSNFKE